MRNNDDIKTFIIGISESINEIYYTIVCKK